MAFIFIQMYFIFLNNEVSLFLLALNCHGMSPEIYCSRTELFDEINAWIVLQTTSHINATKRTLGIISSNALPPMNPDVSTKKLSQLKWIEIVHVLQVSIIFKLAFQ